MKLGQSFSKFLSFAKLQRRTLHMSRYLSGAHDTEFEAAQAQLKTLSEDPGNQAKLQIYALFKQATVGAVSSKRPGMMDFVGRAKWDAWNGVSQLSQDESQQQYITLVSDLAGAQQVVAQPTSSQEADGGGGPSTLQLEARDGMSIIRFNRPTKKNAITIQMYNEIREALHAAGKDPSTRITVLTGSGDYYSSGNDLGNFMGIDPSGMEKMAKDAAVLLEGFVSAFIDHPKPLVALVNGPAVGVAVTTLGLCDMVYASDRTTFHTPFTALGQSPEGCSSVTFPRLMGTGKACEVMLFGKKLSAQEACSANLVTDVFPHDVFQSEAWDRISQFAQLPKDSMRLSKNLMRSEQQTLLHAANKRECELLTERWQSDECVQAIMNFFQKKAKL